MTPLVADLLETPTAFRQWLASREPNEPVGTPNQLCGCPLGNWLAFAGVPSPFVGPFAVHWHVADYDDPRQSPRRELPMWAREFVAVLDRGPQEPIRAWQALGLLRLAERQLVRPAA